MTTAAEQNETGKNILQMVVNGTNIRVNLRGTITKMIVTVAAAARAVAVLAISVMTREDIEEVTFTEAVVVDRGEEAVEASEVVGPAMVVAATDLQKCSKISDIILKARKMPYRCLLGRTKTEKVSFTKKSSRQIRNFTLSF